MPVERQAVVHFLLILLAVPVQYLLVTYFSSTTIQKSYQFQQFLNLANKYKDKYLTWESWQKWCSDIIGHVTSFKLSRNQDTMMSSDPAGSDDGESVAVEVIKYRNPKGYYGMSVEPRSPRPNDIKYRVGQVIRHKQYNYRGVIVGWDAKGKAPVHWLGKSAADIKERWKNQPNYSILVDIRDHARPRMAYVAEEFIEVVPTDKIIHPDIEKYFEGFDGVRYLPRPRLKVLYPHD